MKRLHVDSCAPKYESGKWTWDEKNDAPYFHQHFDLEHADERYINTNGYKFLRTVNPEEELIFRQIYVRPDTTFDADTVVINDIRNLVLFLMPKEFLSMKFLEFMHRPAVHKLLHSLVIYFEYFLRLVEFILIRRDELSGKLAQIQSEQTNEVKRIFSNYLSHYRILVARNYSVIVKGEGDMKKFYHTKEIVNISSKIKDRYFHEYFLAVATQIVWISMHRRAYYIIEMEMNRLFRSEHFLMNRPEYLKLSTVERCLLYGRSNKMVNYRAQTSPLIQELKNILDEDMPILWVGERKYRGSDKRIAYVELEYIVPGPQLLLIDVQHGILGHPKILYDTILTLNWPAVRYANFSEQNDPYHILRKPYLKLPNINEMTLRKMSKNFDHFFKIFRIYESCSSEMLNNWFNREKIINYYRSGGVLMNIVTRCEKELVSVEKRPSVSKIVGEYFQVVSRLRKKDTSSKSTDKKLAVKEGDEFYFED